MTELGCELNNSSVPMAHLKDLNLQHFSVRATKSGYSEIILTLNMLLCFTGKEPSHALSLLHREIQQPYQ